MGTNRLLARAAASLLVLAVALAPVGCASQSDRSGAASTGVLDRVLRSGTIRVAVFEDEGPSGFPDAEGGLRGIDVDIAKDLGGAMGVRVELVPVKSADRIPSLVAGKVDCVMAALTMNGERRREIEFSSPYFRGGAVLVVDPARPGSAAIRTARDLNGRIVAISSDSRNGQLAVQIAPGAKLVRFAGVDEVLEAVRSGKADVAMEDAALAGHAIKTRFPTLKVTGEPLSADYWGIGVRRGDQLWLNYLDGFVFDLQSSGKMAAICATYGVTYYPVNHTY